jgi:deoxyhypusine synthase
MIRQDKVHGICCTGANLEEDIFNLIAHDFYKRVPNYRTLSDADELALLKSGLNRVTDTCIPEEEAMRRVDARILDVWKKASAEGKRFFPYEFVYQMVDSGVLEEFYQIDPSDSWVLAACERKLPIFVPGWEDSTLGNSFVSEVLKGVIDYGCLKSGVELMGELVQWYRDNTVDESMGFFQIGGGIAGDFPICVVPLIQQDLRQDCRLWGYFCQISDSTTSYGSYSGAVPNEKITWGKLDVDTPRFVIESDATIVAPLIFAYVLDQ